MTPEEEDGHFDHFGNETLQQLDLTAILANATTKATKYV